MRSPFKKQETPVQEQPQIPQPTKEVKEKEKAEEKLTIVTSEQMINIKLDAIMSELRLLHDKFEAASK